MSARIDVGPYRLESYSGGWTIGKPRTRVGRDGTEEEFLADQTYPGTLTQALKALQGTWLRESSASTLEELLQELKAFRAELSGLLDLQIREPDKDRHRRSA